MEDNLPSPALVLDLLNGFRRSKVLFVLCSLDIPELIQQHHNNSSSSSAAGASHEAVSLQQLARSLASKQGSPPSADGLRRLLDAAVSLGLLEGNRDGYRLTHVTRTYLCKDSEYSLAGYVMHSDSLLYKLWGDLETSVVTGTNCWQQAFGLDSSDVFASMYSNDANILRFLRGMHGFSKLSARAVLTAFDLRQVTTLVDLGGATGALAREACELYPQLQAIVVDMPSVISKAREHFASAPAEQTRLSWVEGDFFSSEQQLPAGDLFVLSRILHDWEEARCLKLLRTVYNLLPVGGALLLCEMLLDESGTSPPEVLLQSLNMLAQTHGRERTLREYCHLLETVGFRKIEGKKTGSYLDAVIAYKTQPGSSEDAVR